MEKNKTDTFVRETQLNTRISTNIYNSLKVEAAQRNIQMKKLVSEILENHICESKAKRYDFRDNMILK